MIARVEYGGVAAIPDGLEPAPLFTERFGRPIGTLSIDPDAAVDPADITKRFLDSDLDVLVLRYPAQFQRWHAQLQHPDAVIIHADGLVYFAGKPAPWPTDVAPSAVVPGADIGRANVGAVTKAVFADYPNHIAANPLLDSRKVVEGYEQWMLHHLDAPDQDVSVLMSAGTPAAIAAVTVDDVMEIDLAGVIPEHRRRGHYDALLRNLSSRARDEGLLAVVISTQTHNVAAMAAWVKLGWQPAVTLNTVHLVTRRAFDEGER